MLLIRVKRGACSARPVLLPASRCLHAYCNATRSSGQLSHLFFNQVSASMVLLVEAKVLLSFFGELRKLLLFAARARGIIGINVSSVVFPETNEMSAFCPVAGSHGRDCVSAVVQTGLQSSQIRGLDHP